MPAARHHFPTRLTGVFDGAGLGRKSPTLPRMVRSDTAGRMVRASVDQVFTALVDPEALRRWLPPAGMTAEFAHFDARPGGSYRMILTYIDASGARGKSTAGTDVVDVRFVDIVPGDRLVQAVDFVSDDPGQAGTMTITWQMSGSSAGTQVRITADDVPAGISAEDHAAGMASPLSNLAAYLER